MSAQDDQQRLSDAQRLLPECEVLVDAAALSRIYDDLAKRSAEALRDKQPLVLCVMVGGLYATAEITGRWDFAFDLDYLHATRYRGNTQGGEIAWKATPSLALAGRHVLVIDDVLDEGHTLAAVLEALSNQQPASLRTLVTCEKQHRRKHPGVCVDYIGVSLPDRYLFGAGMDYRNAHRQLNRIMALPQGAL